MLLKNNIIIEDKKSDEFDDLQYLVRPVTNRKFLFTNLRTAVYVNQEPRVKRNGVTKERWWKRTIGEPPVLLDSTQIDYSVNQLQLQLRKLGYFSPEITPSIVHRKRDPKKVSVNYNIIVNQPHYVREVNYAITLPEFRRIILLDTANSLLKTGSRYNESVIIEERNRITNLIRNQGYYYATNNIVIVEVDTIDTDLYRDIKERKTLSINIIVDINQIRNENMRNRILYRYAFDKVYIHTNYDLSTTQNQAMDTVRFISYRDKQDSTIYYFITPKEARKKDGKIHRDFKYRTITDNIFTKKGVLYSQEAYNKSSNRLRGLGNFNIINIEFLEDRASLDTVRKTGHLNAQYRLTRGKVNTMALEGSARSDKMNISFSYTNKNLFKGAEHFTANVYAGWYYHNFFARDSAGNRIQNKEESYFDVGANISLSYPRLLFLKNVQKTNAVRYNTLLRAGVNYNDRYKRTKVNVSVAYNWSPNNFITHSVLPINIITYDTSRRATSLSAHSGQYRKRFDKSIDMGISYLFNFVAPIANKNHNFRMSFNLKSSGLAIYGLNELIRKERDWQIFGSSNKEGSGYRYTTYGSGMFNLQYNYTINRKNSIASRISMGLAVPFGGRTDDNYLPFESGFSVGGANSIRGWGYRLLGPGGFNSAAYMERTGDIMMEASLEYRGPIWKAFKFGLFIDAGNMWLIKNDPKMDEMARLYGENFNETDKLQTDPLIRSDFSNIFYKQIAVSVGVGLRLDFNFFLIRLDYGLPIYDPTAPIYVGKTINSKWFEGDKSSQYFNGWNGFQIAIGHAF
jgi:outer membrane protein assembly factor BamA